MHRRKFLNTSALALAAAALDGPAAFSAVPKKSLPIGLQLYTVMAALEQDFEGTLANVARIGYREVETIGSFGRDPRQVRESFEKHGLQSPSQHMVPGDLYDVFKRLVSRQMSFEDASRHWRELMSPERIEAVMEDCIASAKALGQKYLVWQILWEEQMASQALLEQMCKALNTAGALCAKEGLTLNFHNHAAEFKRHDGIIPYDFLLAHTDPQVVKLELDMFWAVNAGADPKAYFKKHPDRYVQCHLKDGTAKGDITVVGQGIVPFGPLLEAARAAGIEHYYVEQDGADKPLEASTQAYDYLRKLL